MKNLPKRSQSVKSCRRLEKLLYQLLNNAIPFPVLSYVMMGHKGDEAREILLYPTPHFTLNKPVRAMLNENGSYSIHKV